MPPPAPCTNRERKSSQSAFAKANTTDTSSAAWKQAMRDVSNPPGTVIRPTEWTKAKAELAAGRDIDYVGASGAVNFDQFGNNGPLWGRRFRIAATSSSKRRMAGVPVLRRL